jgi:hypothetical protein
MVGLVRQGFGSNGSIAQIIRDGLGPGAGDDPDPPATETPLIPPVATITAIWRQDDPGPNLEAAFERQLRDREFGESIRADYRREVLGIDPVRDEIAALERIAAEPMPAYNGPVAQRIDVRSPVSPVAAQAVAQARAPVQMNLSRFGAALGIPGKPGRFK